MVKEQEHLNEMLRIKKEIYLCSSWKRRNDLNKYLNKLEKEWNQYKQIKRGG